MSCILKKKRVDTSLDGPNVVSDEDSDSETKASSSYPLEQISENQVSFRENHPKAHSSKEARTEKSGFLLGLLEVSKYFCHDNQDDHDAEIECGVASGLTTLLRRSLFLYEQARDDPNPSETFKCCGLEYIVSLSTSLTMVLHCSSTVLEHHIKEFESDLMAVLKSLVANFVSSSQKVDTILLQVILTNVCRTVALVHECVPQHMEPLIEILLCVTKSDSPPSTVKLDAAETICTILETYPLQLYPSVLAMLEANASTLISIFSTAPLQLSNDAEFEDDPTLRLFDLAAMSDTIKTKLMRRNCAVRAIARHFKHSGDQVRTKAYAFCRDLVDHQAASQSFSSWMVLENNLVDSLAQASSLEKDSNLQLLAVEVLHRITKQQPFPSVAVMEVFRDLAYSGGQTDEVVVACGAAFCGGMKKEPFPTLEQISTVVDFTTFPFGEIRSVAIDTIESLLTKSENVVILLEKTKMLEHFGRMVSDGADVDCESALNIVRQLSRSSRNHAKICMHSTFLEKLVDFVAKDHVTNVKGHFYAVEIILSLLSNDENTTTFLPYRRLLPWLVNFLNKTTADGSFKELVVAVIVRLSTAYLEQDDW